MIDDVLTVLPEHDENQLYAYKLALPITLMLDNSKILKYFKNEIVNPYSNKILNRDETFVYECDCSEHARVMNVVKIISNSWHTFSDKDKDILWKYMRILVMLANKIQI